VRGPEQARPPHEIVAEARQLADRWAAGFVCGSSSRR